ncbi:MAG: PilZ domain-containing protein [Myxococcota bacterium]
MAPRISRQPKRRYRRRTVRVTVDYTTEAGPAADTATTLGAGGLFIETENPLPKGSRLKMKFRLPGSSYTHEIEGRVCWRKRPEEAGQHAPGMGIEFTDRNGMVPLARELETLD